MGDFKEQLAAIRSLVPKAQASDAPTAKPSLAVAYTLCASRADFDRKLVQFMARHGKRGALVRRLVDAGLWKKA